ncbi:MAG: diguanylate cyclase, partial [Mailhella sp.]
MLGFLLYCSKKLLWILLVFLGITLISFFVMHLAPGSPTDMQTSLNPLVNEAYREKLNALYGLDKPIFIQYYDWLSRLVQFDFGNSLSG